jgi:hypothetical protein
MLGTLAGCCASAAAQSAKSKAQRAKPKILLFFIVFLLTAYASLLTAIE